MMYRLYPFNSLCCQVGALPLSALANGVRRSTLPLFALPEPHLARGEKKGPDEPDDHDLGRSRGNLTTKIDMLCGANGTPLRFLLSGGQASDISYAQPLLDEVSIPSSQRGRPRKRCKWLLADKGCISH
ncbi:hypothetical protein PSFL111601_27850 [Pseudomonas floridensis]